MYASSEEKTQDAPQKANVQESDEIAAPAADIKESPDSYVFAIDLPGLRHTDIKVEVDDNLLVISGERKREIERDGIRYLTMEARVGKFMRSFLLPENANTGDISTWFQNGVLFVTVNKLPPPVPKKRTIDVRTVPSFAHRPL